MTESTESEKGKVPGDARSLAPVGMVLHVSDLQAASRFYQSIGFVQTAAYPRADGELAIVFLAYGPCLLLLGRRDELHYENPARAKKIRRGPHGLGAVFTLLVPDLAQVYEAVRAAGLEILLEPVDEFYGDRVFMFLDPDGYEWKISQTVAQVDTNEVAAIIGAS